MGGLVFGGFGEASDHVDRVVRLTAGGGGRAGLGCNGRALSVADRVLLGLGLMHDLVGLGLRSWSELASGLGMRDLARHLLTRLSFPGSSDVCRSLQAGEM